jgi:hypothetical protein
MGGFTIWAQVGEELKLPLLEGRAKRYKKGQLSVIYTRSLFCKTVFSEQL